MREEQTIGGGDPANNNNHNNHNSLIAPLLPERCCISWTGGKDCNLALLYCWRDPSLHVTDLVVFQPESKCNDNDDDDDNNFQAHPKRIMEAQADSLGLPLRFMTLPSNIPYRDGYVNALQTLRDDHGIQVICTGDMDLVEIENSQDNYIKECCEMVEGGGIRTYLPLWEADRTECLTTLVIKENYRIVFSCVKSPWFDGETWCGRPLDVDAFDEMTAMSKRPLYDDDETEMMIDWGTKDPRRKALDLGGENGEYHTMVLDGPLYEYGIEIVGVAAAVDPTDDNDDDDDDDDDDGTTKSKSIIELNSVVSGPAKNGEDRWWTYDGQTMWSLGKFDVKKRTEI